MTQLFIDHYSKLQLLKFYLRHTSGRTGAELRESVYLVGSTQTCNMKNGGGWGSGGGNITIGVRARAFICAQWPKAVIGSSLLWLLGSISDQLSPSLWQPTSVVQGPPPPSPHHPSHPPTFLACLQTIGAAAQALRQRRRVGPRGLGSSGSPPPPPTPPCPRPAACSPVAAVMSLRHLHSAACVSSGHAHYRSTSYLWEPVRSPGGWRGVGEQFCSTADRTLL